MYSLIIVEDDENIRNGLVNLFPWEEAGFQVKGDFSNGMAAYNYIKEHMETTAILSDIRMPILDGLELSQLINENYPNINMILISGYRDFSYAQQALRYNVRDFLLKPLRHSTLMLTFLKLKEDLDKANATSSDPVHTSQYYEKIVRTVKSYIAENLQNASLEEAAVLVHLSNSYLSRLFKATTGDSFTDYLLKKRMEQACVMLDDIGNKIYEISYSVGYDSPKNFTRAFKNYYNVTPKEYRERGGHVL